MPDIPKDAIDAASLHEQLETQRKSMTIEQKIEYVERLLRERRVRQVAINAERRHTNPDPQSKGWESGDTDTDSI
jgi:hypothetical protein